MRQTRIPLVDRLLGGDGNGRALAAFVQSARDAGESHEDIAYKLRTEVGVQVTKSTVHRWAAELLTDTPATVAS